MSHHRKIILTLFAVVLLMATVHFSVNGFPELSSLNPHSR